MLCHFGGLLGKLTRPACGPAWRRSHCIAHQMQLLGGCGLTSTCFCLPPPCRRGHGLGRGVQHGAGAAWHQRGGLWPGCRGPGGECGWRGRSGWLAAAVRARGAPHVGLAIRRRRDRRANGLISKPFSPACLACGLVTEASACEKLSLPTFAFFCPLPGHRGRQAGGRLPHLCGGHQPWCVYVHLVSVLQLSRCRQPALPSHQAAGHVCHGNRAGSAPSPLCSPPTSPQQPMRLAQTIASNPSWDANMSILLLPADKFEAAKKWGATDCVNPKDYDKPIQQVGVLSFCLGCCSRWRARGSPGDVSTVRAPTNSACTRVPRSSCLLSLAAAAS